MGSAAAGSMIGIGLILTKRHKRDEFLPYGPFLAVAGWLAMMWGPQWVSAYLGLYGPE
jgi:leader peptidase (prepilin peptidase)/N-methyltransferase